MFEVSESIGRLSASSPTAYQPLSGSQNLLVEVALELLGLLAPGRGAAFVAGMPGELGPGPVGGVDVGLDLGQCDRRLGDGAVGEVDRRPRSPSSPGWPGRGWSCGSTRRIRRRRRRRRSRSTPAPGRRAAAARATALSLPPQRCSSPSSMTNSGVASDAAVVGAAPAERERRGRAEPHLVQDLARLLLGGGVDVAALPGGQRPQRTQGQARIPRQQHPRRQQRVPAEQRHEPRRARGDHRPARMLGVEDAQRAEILDAAAEHLGEVAIGRAHLRTALPPLAQPLGRQRPVDRMTARVAQLHRDAVIDRDRLDRHGALGVAGHRQPPGQRAVIGRPTDAGRR